MGGPSAGITRDYKLIQLEAIRGIASIIVLFHHFSLAFFPRIKAFTHHTPFYWIVNGRGAVYLFFVLSGFVLTRRYFESDGGDLLGAVTKRLPRLWLPAAASTLLAYLVLRLGLAWHVEAGHLTGSTWLQTYGKGGFPPVPSYSYALLQTIAVFFSNEYGGLLNTNLWTMKPEFFGSLLCFALVAVIKERHIIFSVIVIMLLLVLGIVAFPFAAGVFLAFLYPCRQVNAPAWAGILAALSGLVLFSAVNLYACTAGALMIITAALAAPAVRKPLSGKTGELLGKLSFPIYLTHIPVICSLGSFSYIFIRRTGLPDAVTAPVCLIITSAATLVVSIPFLKLEAWWVPLLNRTVRRMRSRYSSALATSARRPFSTTTSEVGTPEDRT